MKDNKYSAKYALIYTSLITVILLTPLFFYFVYMKNIHSIQNELFLKEKSLLVVKAMQEFNQNDEFFEYPRFKTFESGLYNESFHPIFTLIKTPINYFKGGYYLDGNDAYLIVKLPKNRYFGARYLVLKNKISYAPVYEKVFIILFTIVIFVFILSLFFLGSFAKPFQKINKQLDNFIKDSMHEINTPLSIINVNIDLYNRKNEQNKYMQRMKAAAKVLSNIYNDMDYLIKHERLEHEKKEIKLSEFLKERIEYFNEVARMKNITINASIQECGVIYINDKELQRLIDNNISNAIKYSYENSYIDIKLHAENGRCHLSFKDYGVGIEKVEKIFSRYYRENSSKGGFGIGLNIVKSIIEKENIELQIESLPSQGSLFIYTFHPKNVN
ncbi:sensor histidine kinase [Sulfurimonas autotrophica]|uniref:histidine kinase n=1 Tax=Sulfurimonas autotrophica (strain ATCC BAA-671 / DSM 16294 / JCM 11897 / OK10) TaxID=563040 RepID=E0US16_SULAO|nr:HAMP domain-containing sensor histidine kinase [Sulfurimonas autotrophica]ADN09039.1 integral membrane sensor signal transduction histidine kinase [Sulfurimonas autotrophica DSM 16294]